MKHFKQPSPSPIEISFWETAKPLIPELEREVWIDKKYRVDFLIKSQKIIIELYGYQYHNSKEKITKDAERERYLQKAGYKVIRFTGSEIYKDVQKCVNEVLILANLQPASQITEASLIKLFNDADKKNLEMQEYEVTITEHNPEPIAKSSVNTKSSVNKPIQKKTKKRKKMFLGMETWQITILGTIGLIMTCSLLCFITIILNNKVS